MAKRKLQRFAELNMLKNVIQPDKEDLLHDNFFYKGRWAEAFFGNNNPIVLELGCGKGEYTIGLAQKYPDINFIGIDIKGDRLWKGGNTALEKNLRNVVFLRIQIESIEFIFRKDEVSEIWIPYPDPQPNKPRIKKRLTSPQFIERYRKILKPHGIIHLKTDNIHLFEYTLDVIRESNHALLFSTKDLYDLKFNDDILSIKTYYEQKFIKKGYRICYLKFGLY
jgi:tRNA (guanine-N7-)-methyltransferase